MQTFWPYTIGAMLAWGIWGFFPRMATINLDFRHATVWEWIGGVAVALPLLFIIGGRPATGGVSFLYALIAGTAGLTGAMLYAKAMSVCQGQTAAVVVVSSLYPIVTVIMSATILREKVTLSQGVGIALCIAGVAVLMREQMK